MDRRHHLVPGLPPECDPARAENLLALDALGCYFILEAGQAENVLIIWNDEGFAISADLDRKLTYILNK